MDLLDGKIRPGHHETIETQLLIRQSTAKPGHAAHA
jgi:hypothetical protein